MNETVVGRPALRGAGVVAALDRIFPILWIGMYLLLPVSGWADEMFVSWFDQQRDLGALESLLGSGRADAIEDSVIGPAYIGAAALLSKVLGFAPGDALIVLTRASYALGVAAGLVLVRTLLARFATPLPMVSLASQLVFLALVLAAGTWYWSDVPWSHFFAAFLAVALYAARFGAQRPSYLNVALAGALAGLLAATRSFELVAVLLAWMIAAGGLALATRTWPQALDGRRLLAGAAAFVVTTVTVYASTRKRDLFLLYGNHLDRQSGSVSSAEIAETPTFSLGLVPTKLVQLFVDPCYRSLCRISDYETGGGAGTNLDLWSLPLAVQLPTLLLLPFCLVGVGVVVLRQARTRHATRELQALTEMTIAATGLVLGYAASTMTGASHLRYGFARDFLLPALLAAIVAVVLGARLAWLALERRRGGRVSSEVAYVVAALVIAVGAIAAAATGRSSGLPRLEARHLGGVTYSAQCVGQSCAVRVAAETTSGAPMTIPSASVLTFGCGTDEARLSVYVTRLDAAVRVAETCAKPRLVAAWPTVMGLPPGSFELAAVRVRNA